MIIFLNNEQAAAGLVDIFMAIQDRIGRWVWAVWAACGFLGAVMGLAAIAIWLPLNAPLGGFDVFLGLFVLAGCLLFGPLAPICIVLCVATMAAFSWVLG